MRILKNLPQTQIYFAHPGSVVIPGNRVSSQLPAHPKLGLKVKQVHTNGAHSFDSPIENTCPIEGFLGVIRL